jgi:pyruvate dehydrogenase E1 component alpha subunit
MGTSVERTSNVLDIYKFADAYDMPGDSVDGMKPEDVHDAIERAARRARDGEGPTLLEIKTYRFKGHSMSDPAKYRTKEELEEYKTKDPIEHVLNVIKTQQFATEAEIETINDKVKAIIDDCVEFAENSPWPDDSEVYKDIYTDENYPYIMD